jgi:hypothetical protein
MQHDTDLPPLPAPNLQQYPKSITAAGMIWVGVGAVWCVNLILILRGLLGSLTELTSPSSAPFLFSRLAGSALGCVIGCFFIYEGVECIRGTAPSTAPMAIGSILIAVIGPAIFFRDLVQAQYLGLLIASAGLLLAGILGLLGRAKYAAWYREERRRRIKAGLE